MTIYLSDFERYGFQRSAIVSFLNEHPTLKTHGVDIGAALDAYRASRAQSAEAPPATPATPDWRRLAWNWKPWTPYECAIALCGDNPILDYGINGYSPNGSNASFETWQHTVRSACAQGEMPYQEDTNRWGNGDYFIAPPDLHEWAKRHRITLLTPPGDPLPTADAALRAEVERLREALAEPSAPQKEPEYLDPNHPRYAPELAAAVRVWCAVSRPAQARTVKQTMLRWLETNEPAVDAERVATVANWNKKGGPAKALG